MTKKKNFLSLFFLVILSFFVRERNRKSLVGFYGTVISRFLFFLVFSTVSSFLFLYGETEKAISAGFGIPNRGAIC